MQILHTGQDHWNIVSTLRTITLRCKYFDSRFISIPTMGKAQIAVLFATKGKAVIVKFMDVLMQCGGSDCGLFAISFATTSVFEEQPGHFLFDQKKMRSHLLYNVSNLKRKRVHSKGKTVEKIQCIVCATCQNCLTRNGLTAHIVENGTIHAL